MSSIHRSRWVKLDTAPCEVGDEAQTFDSNRIHEASSDGIRLESSMKYDAFVGVYRRLTTGYGICRWS